ncbi:MAG: response regulator transcription factor [Myxococcales bacterium]|nr:MAG: response regulator transcription factor [Myxococcales bacterium]
MQLLVIDDDPELQSLLLRALAGDGHAVNSAGSVAAARQMLLQHKPDVIVLDLGLPDGNGFELCRELRERGNRTPILFLTARSEVAHRIEGFESGGDDFLGKPFAVAELRARVRALGRRATSFAATRIVLDDLTIDLSARCALKSKQEVTLTAREWAIIEALAQKKHVVPHVDLLEMVWGEATDSARSSLEVLIARIRRKLGSQVIRTLRGEGYAIGTNEP